MAKTSIFEAVINDIRSDRIKNVVLLCGQEQYLVNWSVGQLTDAYVNPATAMLDLSEFQRGDFVMEDVLAACETFPIASRRKVVILRDLMAVWKRDSKGPTEEEISDLVRFLGNAPDHLLLIITTAESKEDRKNRKGKLYKAIEAVGKIYEFGLLDREDLEKFIRKRFRAAGVVIEPYQVRTLVNESGYLSRDNDYSLYNMENDIRKILHHASGDRITDEDLDGCLSESLEHNIFNLIDAVSANRKSEALDLLHQLILGNESPMTILSRIIGQLDIMLTGAALKEEGHSLQDIQRMTGVNGFRLEKAMKAASRYKVRDLKRILGLALSVEDEIKSGAMADVLALELFIAEI